MFSQERGLPSAMSVKAPLFKAMYLFMIWYKLYLSGFPMHISNVEENWKGGGKEKEASEHC